MSSQSENTQRIAKNTVYLYVRMLFGMLVSLYTSRIILNALGVEDYGIYNVVGGFVAMFSLISSSLSSAIGRFITFELGAGNLEKLKNVVATSLLIQSVIALSVIIIAESVGIWFVNNKMVIPPDRLNAANWVFQASISGFVLALISTPYNALIIAHERMKVFASLGILQILLNLSIVLFIAYAPLEFDRLIVYSLLLMGVSAMMQFIYWLYCRRQFEESSVGPKLDRQCWKEMSGFAGWNVVGCTAGILKDQGVNILINLFYGPVVNAARGIAMSVNTAVGSFAGNFMTAVNPQITKSYAAGDRQYVFSLVERGSRFGYYILMFLAMPIILETPFILTLWLKQYPDSTITFVRLVLIYSLLEVLSNTLITLQVATGRIRNYQIAVGGLLLMNFPLSWLVLKSGAAPHTVYYVAICIGIGCLMLRLWFLRKMVGLSMKYYLKRVVGSVILTNICAIVLPLIIYVVLPHGFVRLSIITVVSSISCIMSALYVGCDKGERGFIMAKILGIKTKFFSHITL